MRISELGMGILLLNHGTINCFLEGEEQMLRFNAILSGPFHLQVKQLPVGFIDVIVVRQLFSFCDV
jgi:hypothetical protein